MRLVHINVKKLGRNRYKLVDTAKVVDLATIQAMQSNPRSHLAFFKKHDRVPSRKVK